MNNTEIARLSDALEAKELREKAALEQQAALETAFTSKCAAADELATKLKESEDLVAQLNEVRRGEAKVECWAVLRNFSCSPTPSESRSV